MQQGRIYPFWILRKKERAKEAAELEQSISVGKEMLSDIQIQQMEACGCVHYFL